MEEWFGPFKDAQGNLTQAGAIWHDFTAFLQLLTAFGFGLIAAAMHYFTSPGMRRADRSFLSTLVILSVLIAVVTIAVGENLAMAFSLAGVLAIVRFRTVVDDTRDIAFVIFAVVTGMAIGAGYYRGPIMVTPLVFFAAWVFRPLPMPKPASHGLLVLRVATGRPIDERVEQSLRSHLKDYHLVGLSTARGGAALDATYAIQLPTADKVFALVNDLGRIEGVQGVEIKDN